MTEYPKKILLGTDGTEDSRRAAELAVALSSGSGAELHVAHVRRKAGPSTVSGGRPGVGAAALPGEPADYAERAGQNLFDQELEGVRAAGGTVAQSHLRVGVPEDELISLSEELGVDLLVVGDGRPRGVRRTGAAVARRRSLGRVAAAVVREAGCPVLVAHG